MNVKSIQEINMEIMPIGRFLIKIPKTTVLSKWYQVYFGTGPISVQKGVSFDQFENIVKNKVDALLAVDHKKGGKLLIEIIKLNKLQGSILIYWENEYLKSRLLKSEDYNFKNDYMYKFNGETWSEPKEIEKHIKFVNHIFESIRPLKPGEIPQEHGFCFEDSILIDEPKAQVSERVIATGIWTDHPDRSSI